MCRKVLKRSFYGTTICLRFQPLLMVPLGCEVRRTDHFGVLEISTAINVSRCEVTLKRSVRSDYGVALSQPQIFSHNQPNR